MRDPANGDLGASGATAERRDPGLAIEALPAIIPVAAPSPNGRAPGQRSAWRLIAVLVAVFCIGGGAWWWTHRPPVLPPGIAWSNGRLEADEIDIATKFPGRIAEVLVDEGTTVTTGQVVARMDTRELAASLAQTEAQIAQAEHMAASARADLEQQRSQLLLAGQELQRVRTLVPRGFATREALDQRQSQFDAATAMLASVQSRSDAAAAALEAARRGADVIRVNLADNTLTAPKDGPIQYRLANVGEVLGSGGKVFTMLDTSYVYMDIFLPTVQAGRATLGAEARIVLDAVPNVVIPAHVSFVSAQNQFTPKTVETQTERDKLMFRVRVRIDPERLRAHAKQVRSGLPGLAYVLIDPHGSWPEALRVTPGP